MEEKEKGTAEKLDIGAGRAPAEGFTAVDKHDFPETDVVHDLDDYPWPFEDDSVEEVIAHNVLEHLESPFRAVREIIRICKDGAEVSVRFPVPEHENTVLDDDHKAVLIPRFFDLFDEIEVVENEKHYPSPRLGIFDFLPIEEAQPDEYRLKLRVRK